MTLLALLARITGGEPETYWDVQAANPYAARAREALAGAVRRLADIVESGDEAAFGALLAQLGGRLGDDAGHYRALGADLFGLVRPPAAAGAPRPVASSAITHEKGSGA
jgi:prephenate dehydrogenase